MRVCAPISPIPILYLFRQRRLRTRLLEPPTLPCKDPFQLPKSCHLAVGNTSTGKPRPFIPTRKRSSHSP